MHKQQSGFTLIELMIVVAIVGILASVAIPAYSDYTVRAKVTEAVAAAGAAKTSVADYYYANNELPSANAQAGLAEETTYSTEIISTISIGSDSDATFDKGAIIVAFKPFGGSITDGDTLVFNPDTTSNSLAWDCSVAVGTNTLPSKYAPANCR
jgi:type IV pilus assembly protein PilA